MSGGVRETLIDASVRLLERDGLPALSARNVATEAGTSTMALYTHFGGMAGLMDAIASEVFARFTKALTEIPQTDDPVADFISMCLAYREFALANPERYQLVFGTSTPASLAAFRTDLTVTGRATDRIEWATSFDALLDVVRRMIAAGRVRDDGDLAIAGRLWSISHGVVTLEMVGFFGHEGHGLTQILGPVVVDAIVGMGDDRDRTTRSMLAATAALAAHD